MTSCPGLVEIGHGAWEGCLEEEIRAGWPDLLAAWQSLPHTVEMPGEEAKRFSRSGIARCRPLPGSWRAWRWETALVVAHDAVNKTILCHLLGLGPADIWAVKQGNGGVSVIDYSWRRGGRGGQPQSHQPSWRRIGSHGGRGSLKRLLRGVQLLEGAGVPLQRTSALFEGQMLVAWGEAAEAGVDAGTHCADASPTALLAPVLVDPHSHLLDPFSGRAETLDSLAAEAAAAGYGSVALCQGQ